MRRHYTVGLLVLTIMGWGMGTAAAAAPDFLSPLSMQVDPNTNIGAYALDFFNHPKSGSVNFTTNNYDVHLPGNVTLQVQDVVPYSGIQPSFSDCNSVATVVFDFFKNIKDSLVNVLSKFVQLKPDSFKDPNAVFTFIKDLCTKFGMVGAFNSSGISTQNVADVRNTTNASTNVIFSGESTSPYPAGFPTGSNAIAGVVIGESGNGKDEWSDGIVVASTSPFMDKFLTMPTWYSSLILYRFLPNPAGTMALQVAGISTGWVDRPPQENPNCYDVVTDPKNPSVYPYATLLKNGCVGEHLPTGIVALNLFNHADPKMKDLVVVSRGFYGDEKDPKARIGYLSFYRRNDKLPVPPDTASFQDIYQFDRSVTPLEGIAESYGLTTVKNTDPKTGKISEGVVVASNKLQGKRYYVYYYIDGMTEPAPRTVGGSAGATLPGFDGFGPYHVYPIDHNSDGCGDILITRAKIDPLGTTIEFADYFDIHLQDKNAAGKCRGTFDAIGTMHQVPLVDPKDPNTKAQISSLAVADFNYDGRIDVMAGDFTTYNDKTAPQGHVNYIHFFENVGGGLLAPVPTRIIATTKDHDKTVGIIDVKADTFANVGVVSGVAAVFPPIAHLEIPNPCVIDPATNKMPALCYICTRDSDVDGFNEIPASQNVDVLTCDVTTGQMVTQKMATDLTMFTYTPDCAKPQNSDTKTGRQWMHEWAKCDNCNPSTDKCTGPEPQSNCTNPNTKQLEPCTASCANPSQIDTSAPPDGVGDICTPNPPQAAKICSDGTPYPDDWFKTQIMVVNPDGTTSYLDADNDIDKDGVPDCKAVVDPNGILVQDCKQDCDKDNPQHQAKLIKTPHEDKVMYADDQPVLAYKEELKLTGNPPPFVDNGHEVTVLLNKSIVKDTPSQCVNGDMACICKQTPSNPLCKCLDPKSPDCPVTTGIPQCTVDVCRGDLTAPFPKMCDFIRPYNDEFRAITGLSIDPFVPVEGAQYHIYCVLPNTPSLSLSDTAAYTKVYKTGQLPKNYFKNSIKPVADDNLITLKPVDLIPADATINGGIALDVSPLTKFDASPLLDVVPDTPVTQAAGSTQIDGILQIETSLTDTSALNGAVAANANVSPIFDASTGAPSKSPKVLTLDIKGFSSPPGCQWGGSDCQKPMGNQISPQLVLNAAKVMVDQYKTAGKPITQDILTDIYKSMPDTGPAFLHQEFIIPGANGNVVIPIQNTMGAMSAEGGCGCTIGAPSTQRNTVLPLVMSALAFCSMMILRRQTAKKR